MTLAMAFWVVFLIALVLHVWSSWPLTRASGGLVLWILIFLLGVGVFGWPLQDSGTRVVHDNPPVEVIHTR